MKYLLLFLCCSAFGQARMHIWREDFYVVIGVEDPEITQSVALQMSTNMITWQSTDLIRYYEGQGHQTNYVYIYEPGNRFFRLIRVATNANFSVITSLAKPAVNYEGWMPYLINGRESASMVYSNDCLTATITYRVPTGNWNIEYNGDLRGQWMVHSNCINGDVWRRIHPTLIGPVNGVATVALPAATYGFIRFRKL